MSTYEPKTKDQSTWQIKSLKGWAPFCNRFITVKPHYTTSILETKFGSVYATKSENLMSQNI